MADSVPSRGYRAITRWPASRFPRSLLAIQPSSAHCERRAVRVCVIRAESLVSHIRTVAWKFRRWRPPPDGGWRKLARIKFSLQTHSTFCWCNLRCKALQRSMHILHLGAQQFTDGCAFLVTHSQRLTKQAPIHDKFLEDRGALRCARVGRAGNSRTMLRRT